MKTRSWIAFVVLMLGLFLPHYHVASPTSDPPSDDPIDLTDAKRGDCPSGQLETTRGCITVPQLKKSVLPKYPDRARARKEDGKVKLSLTLDRAGRIMEVGVIWCVPKNLGFEDAAVAAAQQSVYAPAVLDGEPVPVKIAVKFSFARS